MMLENDCYIKLADDITTRTNAWLASRSCEEMYRAIENKECVICFDDDFPYGDEKKKFIISYLVERMCGPDAEFKFDFGIMGSIWFDTEVFDSIGSVMCAIRVGVVPAGFRRAEYESTEHVFCVFCLSSIYGQ